LRDLAVDIKPAIWLYFCTTKFMNKILLLSALFFSINSFSQDTILNRSTDSPSVIVHKDPRIDLLVKKQIQINEETTREARRVGKGYRLLVINTNNRDEAAAAKTKVYTYFPELKSYLLYQAPYFKLKVGNFRDKKEAEDYQQRLQKYFPKGVFIMNDTIEIKLDKEAETVSRN
jgi:hypothetical protein